MASRSRTWHRLVGGAGLQRDREWNKRDDENAGRAKVLSLIAQIDYALFTTRTVDGESFRARPMAYRKVEDDGDLWFFTKRGSRKVEEVTADHRVLVTFADPKKQHFVTVTGRASVIADRHRVASLWSELFRPWFPNGAEDKDVVLLRVQADKAEYWDTPAGVMVNAFGYVRAVTTGKPFLAGDVGSVDNM